MKALHQLRQQLGLTQRELATFVGKEHTQLHRIESGERLPGADDLETIMLLYQAAAAIPATLQADPLPKATRDNWRIQAEGCRINIHRLGKKLERLQHKAAQCRALLHCVEQLSGKTGLSTRQKRWLETQRYDAGRKLLTCDTSQQTPLQIRITLLQKEAELYEKAMQQHP